MTNADRLVRLEEGIVARCPIYRATKNPNHGKTCGECLRHVADVRAAYQLGVDWSRAL